MKKPVLFALAAALQIVLTLLIAARYEYVERTGETLKIRAYGYDPTDLFRGDYVSINYGDLSAWSGSVEFEPKGGERVYVVPTVSSTGEIISISSVSTDVPDSSRYLAARVVSRNYESPTYGYSSELTSSSMPLSGKWVSQNEYPYPDYSDPKAPVNTKFSVGDSAFAAVSETGAVRALFQGVQDCASELQYAEYSKSLSGVPELPKEADYEKRHSAYAEYCRTFPRVRITSVDVPYVLRFDYGADRLFVEQKTGIPLENALRTETAYAVWKVSSSGKIVLHGLEIGGTLYR